MLVFLFVPGLAMMRNTLKDQDANPGPAGHSSAVQVNM